MDEALSPGSSLPEPQGESGAAAVQRKKKQKEKLTPKQVIFKLGAYSILGYFAFGLLIASPLYTLIALRPNRDPSPYYDVPKIENCPKEDHYFASSKTGEKLHGCLFRNSKTDRVVVLHHGNAGNLVNRLFMARHLLLTGTSVFLYDYRGYGKSEGSATLPSLAEDGLDAYDFVHDKLKFNRIINYGESIGSNIATVVTKARPSEGLILQSGICSLPSVAKSGLFFVNFYPDEIFPKPHLDNLSIISDIKTPVLIVHGLKDTLVHPNQSERLFAKANEPKQFVKLPECGHNDVGDKDEAPFEKALKDFVDSTAKPGHS